MPPSVPGVPGVPFPPGGRGATLTPDLRRKAHARLAERIDLSRVKHKPLSLIRADGRRVVEQLLDAEVPGLPRADRDAFVEDVLAEAVGFGPLEELFRDDAVKEVLVLAPQVVIARKNDAWLPTSARFRDADQVRSVLARYAEAAEPVVPGNPADGGLDVRLANGFRVIAVTPPAIMDVPALALFVRGVAGGSHPGTVQFPVGKSGAIPPGSQSGRPAVPAAAAPTLPPPRPAAPPPVSEPRTPGVFADPMVRVKQRLTERIIAKFAAAGLYDLNQIPLPELRKIVLAQVVEFCTAERLFLDENTQERLALELLAGMNR